MRQKLTLLVRGILILTIIFLSSTLTLRYCSRPPLNNDVIEEQLKLPKDTKEKIIIRKNKIVDVTHKGGNSDYIPDEGKSEVVIKDDGKVEVKIKKSGVCFRPGIGGGFIGTHPRLIVDAKLAYYNRFGMVAGTSIHKRDWSKPYVAISYVVYNNTSIYTGINVEKNLVVGVRVSF